MEEIKKKGHRKGHYKKRTSYREDALAAAKDLLYGPEVICQIQHAKSDAEIERVMNTARKSSR